MTTFKSYTFDIKPKLADSDIVKVLVIGTSEEDAMIRAISAGYDIVSPKLNVVDQLIHSVNTK